MRQSRRRLVVVWAAAAAAAGAATALFLRRRGSKDAAGTNDCRRNKCARGDGQGPTVDNSANTKLLGLQPVPPEKRTCTQCHAHLERKCYSKKQWKADPRRCNECTALNTNPPPAAVCSYCSKPTDTPTKEHLLPRSAGGTRTIMVCQPCNRTRGNSGVYLPFRTYIDARPSEWADAIRSTKSSHTDKLAVWLIEAKLVAFTLSALIQPTGALDRTS